MEVQTSVTGSAQSSVSPSKALASSVANLSLSNSQESSNMCSTGKTNCDNGKVNGGVKPKVFAKDKHVKKKVSLSLDTVDESPPSSPRPPSKPRERRGAVDSMMKSGSTHSCHLSE